MKQTAFPGDELRARRVELALSVYEVYRNTRVPARIVEALESGEVEGLPDACYAVGFVKTYCTFLGLEPDRFVDSFRACQRPAAKRFFRRKRDRSLQYPSWLNEALTWASVLLAVALCWLTYSVVFHPQADVADKRVEAGRVEMVVPPAPADDRR